MTAARAQVAIMPLADLAERGCVLVELDGLEVGVFRVDGEVHAYENRCAHQGGPVCRGDLVPRERERLSSGGESLGVVADETEWHVACPWHGWEYDLRTGEHIGDRRQRLRRVPARVQDSQVVLDLPVVDA